MYSIFHVDRSYRLDVCVFDYHKVIDRSDMNDLMDEKDIDHRRRWEEIFS